MLAIVGVVLVIGMVFGGYVLAGGKFGIILKALPFELMMIGGAAAGTFLIANKADVVKGALADTRRVVAGPHWHKDDYRDLLSLMFLIVKLLKTKGVLALEPHLDNPHESALFGRFPKIQQDHFALEFITDTLRMMTMSMDDPYQVEECMQRQLRKHHAELHARAAALQSIADATPALGHRRRGAGRGEDHGLDQPAGRDPGRDDRRRPGRHLSRRLPRLRLHRPDRRQDEPDLRGGCAVLRHHPRLPGRPTCRATRRRSRSSSRAATCRRRCSRASMPWTRCSSALPADPLAA